MNDHVVATLVREELRVETRSGSTLHVLIAYAVAALTLIAISIGADLRLLTELAPGLLWGLVVVLGSLAAVRDGYCDDPARRDVLVLAGVTGTVLWSARVIASAALVLALELTLTGAAVVLLDLRIGDPAVHVAAVLVVAVGLSALGVLARDLTRGPRTSTMLVPLIATPLAVPLALAPVEAQALATAGAGGWAWLAVAGLVSTVALIIGALVAADNERVT